MAEFISIEADIREAVEAIDAPQKKYKAIRKRMLRGIGTSVRKAIRKNYGSFLNKESGNLYKYISGSKSFISNGKGIVVAPKARAENQQFYGYSLAKGSEIRRKNAKALTFKIGDQWCRKHSVKLPERDWFVGPARDYLQSKAYRDRLDQLIQREIVRLEKQRSKGK